MLESQAERRTQPFYKEIGERVGGDLHGNVYELDERWVVKSLKLPWRIVGNWRGKLEENLVEDYRLLEKYLGPFIPKTHIIKGVDRDGRKSILFVQKKIKGRTLREIPWEEISQNKALAEQMNVFRGAVCTMYNETGRTPDLHGTHKNQYDLKLTNNLIVDEDNKLWFIDIDLIGPFWSLNNPLGAKHMEKIMASVNAFVERLGGEEKVACDKRSLAGEEYVKILS